MFKRKQKDNLPPCAGYPKHCYDKGRPLPMDEKPGFWERLIVGKYD